jgi:hypothetical protein
MKAGRWIMSKESGIISLTPSEFEYLPEIFFPPNKNSVNPRYSGYE